MARPKRLPAPVTSTAGEEAIRGTEGMDDNQSMETQAKSLATALKALIQARLAADGGWLAFDRFMALALYAPGLGYYAAGQGQIGRMPAQGSDFVTAPEISLYFGKALASSVAEALAHTQTNAVLEFGAGNGTLAVQLLEALGDAVHSYTIVEVSGALRERQAQTLAAFGSRVQWVSELPDSINAVVVGNEVLDAMPVRLLQRTAGVWHERGVVWDEASYAFAWQDRVTDERPPMDIEGAHDYLTEIHPQALAFIRSVGERLQRGAMFLIDYGFPEAEYYHAQRHMGTLMCHQAHRSDGDPLQSVGLKDITAHVDFTGVALAAQDVGLAVLGYTSQAHFLLNNGLLGLLENATVADRAMAQKLITEHEMGELFKVIALGRGDAWQPLGFVQGDRTHRL
jgi:SAM-dependent MidA family methyltransferase